MAMMKLLQMLIIGLSLVSLTLSQDHHRSHNYGFEINDSINNFRGLDGSSFSVNPSSTIICPTINGCAECNLYSKNSVNCEWSNNGCEAQFTYDPQMPWYQYLQSCAQFDLTTITQIQNYCKSSPQPTIFTTASLTLPNLNNQFGDINLYCEWVFNRIDPDQYVYVEFTAFDAYMAFNIEGQYTDGTPFSYDIGNNYFLFNAENVQYINLHYFSQISYNSAPFKVQMTYKKVNTRNFTSIFLAIGTILILIGLLSLLGFRCYQNIKHRRNLGSERNIHDREINYIIANNPGIVVNVEQHVQAETILKNKNKQIIEKLLETELMPVMYQEYLNEYNASCTICMEGFITGKYDVTVLHCKHIFHHNCLKNWLYKNLTHPKCPNCNYTVAEKSVNSTPFNNQSNFNDNTQNNLNAANNIRNVVNNQEGFPRLSSENNNSHRYVAVSRTNINMPVGNGTNL